MKQKYHQFGALLSNLRIQAGFNTQSDFAKAVEMGQQTVSRWESGASRPKSDQILKLADILKTKPLLLLDAAGYTKTQQESPVILSFDKPFPFMSLTPDSFERFCLDLLSKTHPEATVHLWGGAGHKQDGIDIKIDHPDGAVHTYQCKRETEFGPQKVKEAIEYQTVAAEKKYILLARIASPQARQEASRHDGWNILDQEDLSRMVRNLSKQDQKCLVDIYFPGQRMALLCEPEPGIWRDSATHFAPLMNPSTPLNHTLSLIGRHNEERRLFNVCINTGSENENSKRIIYLVGAAGIGKSRLLKDTIAKIEAQHRDIRVWFWDGISTITSKDLESLGQGRKLLVVDGCREAEALIPLFDFVLRNQNITLIVATCFDEYNRLKSEAVDVGIFGTMVEEIRLNPLSESETTKIALEILKLNHGNESMAQHIAKWTTDSPLVTVLSTHLALKENISFAKVRGHIKGKFSKLLVGEVGQKNDQAPIHQTLKVLALVQPFEIHDARLIECIASIERLESVTIKRLLRILVEAGVLWKNQNNEYRLSPETMSDIIIEDVCLGVENKSTGYADEVFKALDTYAPEYISNLIYNLSRFEWTANMHTTDTVSLLDSIWSNLQDSEDDIEIIDRVAYYQPKKVLGFVEKLMMSRLERYPKAIFDDVTPIIQIVAQHRDFLAQACDLLWLMSKHYDASSQSLNANYNHPIRILKEIFSYKPDKPKGYLTVVVDWAIDLLKNYNAKDYPASPFDFLSEVMRTEGARMETSGHSIKTMEITNNNYESVAPLRSKVIEAFLKTLVSPDIKKSYEAAKFLPNCLAYSNNDKCVWTEEAINTLKKINMLVKNQKTRNYTLVALSLEIDNLLLRGKYTTTEFLKNIHSMIHKTIQADKELCMIAIMMGQASFLMYDEDYKAKIKSIIDKFFQERDCQNDDPIARHNLELFQFNPLILSHHLFLLNLDTKEREEFQESLLSIKTDFIKRVFAMERTCELNLDFSEHCVQQALTPQDNDVLWQLAWIPLSILLHYNRLKGQEYAAELLKSADKNQRELVGQAYGNLSMKEYQLDESDIAILSQILNDSDESVIFLGIKAVSNIIDRRNYTEGFELFVTVRKDVSRDLIKRMFQELQYILFDAYAPSNPSKFLSEEIANSLCQYLVDLPSIPDSFNDGVEAFLMKIIDLYPEIILDLVLKRAKHAVKNKLLEHTFFPSYQIIDMQFLNRETNGTFSKEHRRIKNSETFLSALRNILGVRDTISQWLDTHNDGSNSYENVKQFLRVEILEEPAFDKRSDKLMAANTDHIFKEARDYICKTFLNKGDNGWLTHNDSDKAIKEFYGLVDGAFIAAGKLNQEDRNFSQNKWRESRENQKFTEEIKPLYDVFKGYLKAYQQTLDHSIDCFDTQATIIPVHSSDNTSKQRYALQLFPSQETLEEMKVPSRIKFCGDREQYDGCIEFSDGLQQKIEVTVANKGAVQGKLKTNMRQNGYAMHPMNDTAKIINACCEAIGKKLNDDKHIGKYTNCWLIVVLNGWQFDDVDDLESLLHFFKEIMQTERYSVDWRKIKSIIFYPGS